MIEFTVDPETSRAIVKNPDLSEQFTKTIYYFLIIFYK